MLVPKQRHNSSRGKRRRGGHTALKPKSFVACEKCGKMIMAHQACSFCGSFKGKEVFDVTKSAKLKKTSSTK